jgi:localization factor PodJL
VQGLSRKIDQFAASSEDPRAPAQLEAAIFGLRSVVSQVASQDALTRLSDEVRGLAAKVDLIAEASMPGGADAVSSLEQQVATLVHALEAAARREPAMPPKLEALLEMLGEKIEQIELSRGDHLALGSLEDRVVKLVEKLDANDSRLSHLGAIERGLADLVVKLDDLRSGNGRALSVRDAGALAGSEVGEIKRHIAEIKDVQSANERHAKGIFQAVHGTLGKVFERLAALEAEMRGGPDRRASGASAAQQHTQMTAPPGSSASEAIATPCPPHNGQPRDRGLPPDFPLEPGTGTSPVPVPGSPADRIAVSAAALVPAKPPKANPGISSLIIAARRAAQTAGEAPPPRPARARVAPAVAPVKRSLRSVAVAVSALVIVLGAMQVATNMLAVNSTDTMAPNQPAQPARRASEASTPSASAPAAPGRRSAVASPDDVITTATPPSGLVVVDETRRAAPPSAAGPVVSETPEREATGSIGRPATPSPAAPGPAEAPGPRLVAADDIPAAITSPILRAALAQGDPSAEYELALRYAEGRGVPRSLQEAARWFDRAAKSGLVPAQFRLGTIYEKGHGVKKDIEAARQLYVSAAEKGNAKAMHNLGALYAEGLNGKADYKVAALWFRKAAAHGVRDSQFNLGILYARGVGVDQNLPESFKWFSLAAAQGDPDAAKKRDDVASRLDQQALTAAKLAIETWVAVPQPDAATNVRVPAGGWDKLPTAPPSKPKLRPAAPKPDPS